MSKYTTGEIAKLCDVSVRTVQYYDSRNILVPTELSEGGRRLYSEDDLKRMRVICFLREAGFSINSIGGVLSEENSKNIVSVLVEQQEQTLKEELNERQKKLDMLKSIKRELKDVELQRFSVESIGDIARVVKYKNKLKKLRATSLIIGIPVSVLQCTSIILWIATGIWWLFAVWACVAVIYGVWISTYYFSHVAYICPECHEMFKPKFKEAFWANHTPKMRRLTCPKCGRKGLCIEVYSEKEGNNNG